MPLQPLYSPFSPIPPRIQSPSQTHTIRSTQNSNYLKNERPFFAQYSSNAMAFTPCIFDWKPGQNITPGLSPLVARYASLFPFASGKKRVFGEEQSRLMLKCSLEMHGRWRKMAFVNLTVVRLKLDRPAMFIGWNLVHDPVKSRKIPLPAISFPEKIWIFRLNVWLYIFVQRLNKF